MRAKKSLGQNFLADDSIAARIVREFAPRAGETIIEIGPGHGALTRHLVGHAGRLIAIELDRELISPLQARFGGRGDFKVIEADALEIDLCREIEPASAARVIANLPYYISTAILQRLLAQRRCLTELVLMLQREVVERITARAGDRERGYLSVLVEAYCEAEKLFEIAPGAFRPAPKVWSAVVRLRPRPHAALGSITDEALFRLVVSTGFAQRRKTIFNNLRNAPVELVERIRAIGGADRLLERAAIAPHRRAETLTLAEWKNLTTGLID